MQDVRAAYLDACNNAERACAKLDRLQQLVDKVAASLRSPNRCLRTTGSYYDMNIPAGLTIRSQDWPTADQLSDATKDYWKLAVQANYVWAKLTEVQKRGLNPPPAI